MSSTPLPPSLHQGVASLSGLIDSIERASENAACPFIIAASGGSCTGKSSQLSAALRERFRDEVETIEMDAFSCLILDPGCLDPRYRWDDPLLYRLEETAQGLKGLQIGTPMQVPLFTFGIRGAQGWRAVTAKRYLLIDGLYALHEALRPYVDFGIYAQSPLNHRLIRRCFRSMYDRYRHPEPSRTVEGFFDTVLRAHRCFVAPQASSAHAIVEFDYSVEASLRRFQCNFVPIADNDGLWRAWASLQDGSLQVQPGDSPRLRLIHQQRCYFDVALSPQTYATMLDCDPEEY